MTQWIDLVALSSCKVAPRAVLGHVGAGSEITTKVPLPGFLGDQGEGRVSLLCTAFW
jgi:hypothetical protein